MSRTLIKISLLFFSAFSLWMVSCYYDSEEFLFPQINVECDTMDITYSQTIQPILQSACYVCHNNSNAGISGGNIKLENYSDVKIAALNGSLYGAVAHEGGYSPMPKGGSRLSDCALLQIKGWIDKGAPDN